MMNAERIPEGSFSQIQELHNCEWRYWFGRQYKPVDRAAPPDLGTAVHIGIAEVLRGREPLIAIHEWAEKERVRLETYDQIMPEAVTDGFDILSEVEMKAPAIIKRWILWWQTNFVGWTPRAVEEWFVVNTGDMVYNFIVDLLIDDPDGNTWVIDWKVRQQFMTIESEECNLQKALYQWGLMKLGIETRGSGIVQIYPGVPATPEINKNGTISRSKVRTDWETYSATCIANNQDPNDYMDYRQKIEDARWEWFLMHRVFRTPEEIEAIANSILRPSLKRCHALVSGEIDPIRALSQYRCSNCWSRLPCLESLRGTPLDELTLGYERRTNEGSGSTRRRN